MGYTATPDDAAAMSGMEALMAVPLDAGSASARLAGLLDDDTLHDMLWLAAQAGPRVDARPVVALSLDEFVNWSAAGPWPEDVRERGRMIVERFRDADISAHVSRTVMPDTPEAAAAHVAEILGIGPAEAARRLDVRRGTAPGTHAVRDGDSGEIFRVEAVYGVVLGSDGPVRERLAESLFADAPGPRP